MRPKNAGVLFWRGKKHSLKLSKHTKLERKEKFWAMQYHPICLQQFHLLELEVNALPHFLLKGRTITVGLRWHWNWFTAEIIQNPHPSVMNPYPYHLLSLPPLSFSASLLCSVPHLNAWRFPTPHSVKADRNQTSGNMRCHFHGLRHARHLGD